MTVLDPLAAHGAPPSVPNVRDLTAALIREQQLSSRLWGLLRAKGMSDEQIRIRVTPPAKGAKETP